MNSALTQPHTTPDAPTRSDEPIYGDIPALYALGIVTPVRDVAKRRFRIGPIKVGVLTIVLAALTAIALYLLTQPL